MPTKISSCFEFQKVHIIAALLSSSPVHSLPQKDKVMIMLVEQNCLLLHDKKYTAKMLEVASDFKPGCQSILKMLITKGNFLFSFYSVTNTSGATQSFSANHKTSSEQKNRSSFILD